MGERIKRPLVVTTKLVFGLIAVLLVGISTLLILVDGVAILFTYASILFALLAMGAKHNKLLITYWIIFLMANFLFGWSAYRDRNHGSQAHLGSPMNYNNFEKCSHAMFEGVSHVQKGLNPEQKRQFALCMDQ